MDTNIFEDLGRKLNPSEVSKPALAGAILVILVIALITGLRMAEAVAANGFEVMKAPSQAEVHAAEDVAAEDGAGSTMFVHVSGAVVSPGLYEVKPGGRVADAVNAAGGFAEGAATDSVNLARLIADGEQIVVAANAPQEGDDTAAFNDVAASSNGLVNINNASADELKSLPGIGDVTAMRIVSDRQANGRFKSVDELKRVDGIGDKKFEALSGLVCV